MSEDTMNHITGPRKTMKIALFLMGGTIDGANSDEGALRVHSEAALWLKQQTGINASIVAICNKDSREITKEDQDALIAQIESSPYDRILITHGTFTIAQTGKILKEVFAGTNKTILLVGAWVPFGEVDSDAPQQMNYAIETLTKGKAGVWIAMDGELFDPDLTEKVFAEGQYKLVQQKCNYD